MRPEKDIIVQTFIFFFVLRYICRVKIILRASANKLWQISRQVTASSSSRMRRSRNEEGNRQAGSYFTLIQRLISVGHNIYNAFTVSNAMTRHMGSFLCSVCTYMHDDSANRKVRYRHRTEHPLRHLLPSNAFKSRVKHTR